MKQVARFQSSKISTLRDCAIQIACAAILLTFLQPTHADDPSGQPRTATSPQLLVIFIGGYDSDPTAEQIAGTAPKNRGNSGLYQLCDDLKDKRIVCEYFNWNGTRAGKIAAQQPPQAAIIVQKIREHIQQYPHSKIAIVGNSWGGHTAWQTASQLHDSELPLAINRIIFLDPSSVGRAADRHPQKLPVNIKQATHYHTHNIYCWGSWTHERMRNIDLGDPELGYSQNGQPAYAAKFDFGAHVAAEWDARIHAEIKAELLRLLPPQ